MPKVSVIVPIYNVEDYIERCVHSLFRQSIASDIEYIFVNDCTQDKSIEIVEKVSNSYPELTSNITIINNERNLGVAETRSIGVSKATGEYIIHCDPDDFIDRDMYEIMYDRAKEDRSDIVLCDIYIHDKNSSYISTQRPDELNSSSLMQSIGGSSRTRLHGGLWNKMMKSSAYEGIKFPMVACYCEDVAVLMDILKKPLSVSYIPHPLYHYYIDTTNSLAKTITAAALTKDLKLIELFEYKARNNSQDTAYCNSLYSMIIWIIFNRAFKSGVLTDTEFKEKFSRFQSYIDYNMQLPYIAKMLLRSSMRGSLNISRGIFQILNKIRKSIS